MTDTPHEPTRMPSDLERLICNYTRNDRNAINRFLGVAEQCGYSLVSADLQAQPEQGEHHFPEGWSFVEKKTHYQINKGNTVVASLTGPDAKKNAAFIAAAVQVGLEIDEDNRYEIDNLFKALKIIIQTGVGHETQKGNGLKFLQELYNRMNLCVKSPAPAVDLEESDVEWITNDNAELGVKIGNQFFFCYKGRSLVYESGLHDDGTPLMWRPVFKREFGECIHPVNYKNPELIGTVSLDDSEEWKPVAAASGHIVTGKV